MQASTYAAAGAVIGTVVPVVGTALGGAIGALAGSLLGDGGVAGGGSGGPMAMATPQASQAAAFGSGIDGSGWIINFGDGNSNTLDNRQDKTITATGPTATATPTASMSPYGTYLSGAPGVASAMGLGELASVPLIVWIALAGAVAWRMSKSGK